jgi:pescadillo protein
MGRRVEGKTKKKSVKANVTSKFGSKRKASRMGKKVKKGQMGPNTEFITRSSALKRLQITLKDFRRLCILKGIYPRVPVKGLKGNDKVYYDIKDISYIMHEPLLQKFRDFKSFMKKIRKAAGRNQVGEARYGVSHLLLAMLLSDILDVDFRRKDELKPQITLDHLVKERYPRFIDALRDLDDALCMVHLFAAMPSTGRITADRTANCAKLVRHWQHYIAKSRTLQKVFVSVKGVYFQAEVMGEPITWLVPHQFTQAIPKEVDVRVMLTFLEFYEVFLQFVLFKLYASQGLQYPPKIDRQLDAEGCFLLALKSDRVETAGTTGEGGAAPAPETPAVTTAPTKASKSAKASAVSLSTLPKLLKDLTNQEGEEEDEEEEELGLLAAPLNDALQVSTVFGGSTSRAVHDEDDDETEQRVFATQSGDPLKRLFANLVFFINRECPLEWLQLSALAFGGKVAWDGPMSPFAVDDPRITHQIVDRPQQGIQSSTREYVQPQWVFDSINAQMLLPVHNYRPGAKLPPHLSPFVDDEKEGYMPKYRAEIRKLQSQHSGDGALVEAESAAGKKVPAAAESDDEEEEDEEVQHAKTAGGKKKAAQTAADKRKAGAESAVATQSKKQKVAAPVSEEEESEEDDSEASEGEEDDSESEGEKQQELLKSMTGKSAGKKGPKGVVFQNSEDGAPEVSVQSLLSLVPSRPVCLWFWCVMSGSGVVEFVQKGIPAHDSCPDAHCEVRGRTAHQPGLLTC